MKKLIALVIVVIIGVLLYLSGSPKEPKPIMSDVLQFKSSLMSMGLNYCVWYKLEIYNDTSNTSFSTEFRPEFVVKDNEMSPFCASPEIQNFTHKIYCTTGSKNCLLLDENVSGMF